ncbi:MAG: PQQ-dependent sugar dehydrogenase, partial [Opitutaceae bacterium]|nr:PQQ-dependent sugar dehydrogenase [Verrucomicrobiales bacterium]
MPRPNHFVLLIAAMLLCMTARLSAQPYGLESRPPVGRFLNGTLPESAPFVSGNWSAVVAFTNIVFTNAVGLTHLPGTSRLVVWEREGRVYSFEHDPSVTTKTLMLDISNQCQGWDDSGLLGLAFHPGFVTNRFVFLWYAWVSPGTVIGNPNARPPTNTPNRDRLSRFTVDANGVVIPGSEVIFIDQNSQTVWHNGGGLFFHPINGFLHITNGDDARGANNQRINTSLHSGVLRIDVDQRGGSISHPIPRQPAGGTTANYFIPNSNPFVGQANVLEEFYAIGLRSPHRMTHDPVSDRIFIGDVGQGAREEISVIEPADAPGLNFQWDRIEGLNGDLVPPYLGVNKRPILDYVHSDGNFAVIGGYVYRGAEFSADLGGKYIFGDNGSKRIWVMNEATSPATKIELCVMPSGPGPNSGNDYVGLSSFGLDQNNELFMCQMSSVGGRIYKLKRGGTTNAPLPGLLSQTGAFSDTPAMIPSAGLIPYDVTSPLWSDGAAKSR